MLQIVYFLFLLVLAPTVSAVEPERPEGTNCRLPAPPVPCQNVAAETDWKDSDALLKAIDSYGARYVVWEVLKDWEKWDDVMEKISSGETRWIRIATLLYPETDAGITSALIITMAEALPNSPENVLPTIGQGFDLEDVCGFPFIEPEIPFLMDHYDRATLALKRPLRPELKEIQSKCIKELNMQYVRIVKK